MTARIIPFPARERVDLDAVEERLAASVRELDDGDLSRLLYDLATTGAPVLCELLEAAGAPVTHCSGCRRRHWSHQPCRTGS
jgi:hypothetical protein